MAFVSHFMTTWFIHFFIYFSHGLAVYYSIIAYWLLLIGETVWEMVHFRFVFFFFFLISSKIEFSEKKNEQSRNRFECISLEIAKMTMNWVSSTQQSLFENDKNELFRQWRFRCVCCLTRAHSPKLNECFLRLFFCSLVVGGKRVHEPIRACTNKTTSDDKTVSFYFFLLRSTTNDVRVRQNIQFSQSQNRFTREIQQRKWRTATATAKNWAHFPFVAIFCFSLVLFKLLSMNLSTKMREKKICRCLQCTTSQQFDLI